MKFNIDNFIGPYDSSEAYLKTKEKEGYKFTVKNHSYFFTCHDPEPWGKTWTVQVNPSKRKRENQKGETLKWIHSTRFKLMPIEPELAWATIEWYEEYAKTFYLAVGRDERPLLWVGSSENQRHENQLLNGVIRSK